MKVNEWIRISRESKGLMPGQLADAIGCSVSSIHAWEKGVCEPSAEMASLLLLYFGLPDKLEIMGTTFSMHSIPGTDRVLLGIDRSNVEAHAKKMWNKQHPDTPSNDG